MGRFLGGLASQLLVSFDLMDYHELNYVSLSCVSIAFVFALFLPSVNQSIYFHRAENQNEINSSGETGNSKKTTLFDKLQRTKIYLWTDFREGFSNIQILKWSIWWAVATSGHLQVINYIQALWETIVSSENSNVDRQLYNGAVEATHTLLSSFFLKKCLMSNKSGCNLNCN